MEQSFLIEVGLPISLMIIMAGMGLGLTFRDFGEVLLRPKALVVGTVAQVFLVPLIAFGLARLMSLSAEIAVGLVVVAACPGGTTSNIFALLARGNVALSIALTVVASLVTIVTIPLFTNSALVLFASDNADRVVGLPIVRTIQALSFVIIAPVVAGMFVRRRASSFAQWSQRYVGGFGLLVLLVFVLAIVYGTRDEIPSLLAQAGPATATLSVVGIGAGVASSRLLGVGVRNGLTIAIEVGIKNGTIGLMVALTLLQSAQMAIPTAVYGVQMYLFGGMLVLWGRRKLAPEHVRSDCW